MVRQDTAHPILKMGRDNSHPIKKTIFSIIAFSNWNYGVQFRADQLHLSPNYFGDLVKKEIGKTAIEHIQRKMMDTAKDYLVQTDKSISEIAYCLGYQYPQYFSRAFKKATGQTPNEYRMTE